MHTQALNPIEVDYTMNDLIKDASDALLIPVNELRSNSRKRFITEARQIAIFLAYELRLCSSLTELGMYFNRDHSTVIHSVKTIQALKATNQAIRNKYAQVASHVYHTRLMKRSNSVFEAWAINIPQL